MKDRIKEFLIAKSLNAADLADRIGVQRSSVSHILNGRNNPSAAFIEKLLTTFPEIDARWLLVGDGVMTANPEKPASIVSEQKISPELPAAPEKKVAPVQLNISGKAEKSIRKIERIVIFYDDRTFLEYVTQ